MILCRQAPALLERSQWSTADGNPVTIASTPKSDSDDGWEIIANHSTDSEGWTYGSVFRRVHQQETRADFCTVVQRSHQLPLGVHCTFLVHTHTVLMQAPGLQQARGPVIAEGL